ncbi:Na+/H+ antiporter NhaD [Saccharopolyspora kobensis]|uniref:Na+/H+ antiporter NhaD n=1 Tax=Saccharopolyspora kobensis TaxID=146035 RepID=A0A1H5US21_9PSEU|nr:SLC13 family permease [Saccharopolyspora kobensis]SEF77770.1 Na+/H+ antiporter NhaD [Saccharopolyspora kobensis]SFC70225.1 transporter, UIT1 family [Saccharopolyspora kobensis]
MVQSIAFGVFVIAFAVAAIRNVNIGIVLFPAACAVGLGLADMTLEDVIAGFPLNILVLLVGVTYFFGIAHSNGTIQWLVDAALAGVGERDRLLPLAFFVLTGTISAMGAPLGGLVTAPIGMSVAHERRIDPMLMALAMGTGLSAGAFAPTSLFGIITLGTAKEAGIAISPAVLFGSALVLNLVFLAVAYVLFGKQRQQASREPQREKAAANVGIPLSEYGQSTLTAELEPEADLGKRSRPTAVQLLTLAAIGLLIVLTIVIALLGGEPDIGVLCFGLGAALALLEPSAAKKAMTRIDWGSVLLVGGIITYVGVLSELGVFDSLGEHAAHVGAPLLAALLLCAVAALVSAFASTTGMLAALVPLALPLIADGGVPGWALICSIGLCASIVDVSPFSTVGAAFTASTVDEAQRPRMTRLLTWWSMSLVVIGPIALTVLLILPGKIFS